MREYLLGIFALVFLIGVCRMIGYRSEDDAASRFAFAVLVLYTVLTPVFSGGVNIGSLDMGDFDISIPEGDRDYITVTESAFKNGVHSLICSEFSLSQDEVRVEVEGFDIERVRASSIRVYLSGRAALADNKRIEKYVTDNGLGECDVRIELG